MLGDRIEEFCDAELVDHFNYTVFPNIHPWGGFNRIVYRFRPNGDDHETSIFEVMYVTPFAGERPAPATVRSLGADDRWTDAPELDSLGMVLDQDTFNMEQVQKGLKILRRDGVTVSRYQEAIVRWRQDLLDEWVGRSDRRQSATRSRGPSTSPTGPVACGSRRTASWGTSRATAAGSRASCGRRIPSCASG